MDFTHLAHLDPDYDRHHQQQGEQPAKHYLPENSRIKVAVWAVEKWAALGFVRLSLPRHYQRRALERLQAEPAEVDLRYARRSLSVVLLSYSHLLRCVVLLQ
jgi:hypothetical protein